MGQILAPDNLPDLVIASTTTITMATSYLGRSTRITVGGQQYLYSSVITLNFATTGINGLDTGAIAANSLYYIYAITASGVPGLIASLAAPGTGPTGFTSWKEVGRCRTLSSAATLAQITNRIGGASSLSLAGSESSAIYVPVLGAGITASVNSARWKRSIETIEVIGSLTVSNTGAVAQFTVSLPVNQTVNGNNLPRNSASLLYQLGVGSFYSGSTTDTLQPYTSSALLIAFVRRGSNLGDLNGNGMASGNIIDYRFTVPIAEFAGLYT